MVATDRTSCHAEAVTRLRLLLPLLSIALGSCSYTYNVRAVVIGGRLAFVVDPKSRHDASCMNAIDVIASRGVAAQASPGDDISRVKYGTFWHERLDYDCLDKFPIYYGQQFKGVHRPLGQVIETVAAKPLKIGVVYEVTTTTGATGYGNGAFKILPDRTVVNVPPPALTDENDMMEPVIGNDS